MTKPIVRSEAEKVKNLIQNYAAGLIITQTKKTCPEIAKSLSQNHDSVYKTLKSQDLLLPIFPKLLIDMVRHFSSFRKGWLVIDDTLIAKLFAKFIEGLDLHYNSAIGRCEKGLCAVTIAWTDGKITIPLDFEFWLSKDILDKDYLTKIQLAQILIKKLIETIEFEGVILDGLYASAEMIKFLNELNIKFEMRMHSNRIITTRNGRKIKLSNLRELKMRRNERSRSMLAQWKGINLYFTAELRIDKNGEKSIVYIVSNWEAPSKVHVATYAMRWVTEKFYRTSKQSLGLRDSGTRAIRKQKVHIYSIFYAYAFLQVKKEQIGALNVEEVIKYYQDAKPRQIQLDLEAFSQIFEASA